MAIEIKKAIRSVIGGQIAPIYYLKGIFCSSKEPLVAYNSLVKSSNIFSNNHRLSNLAKL